MTSPFEGSIMEQIKPRGGARPGAGRPPGSKNRPLIDLAKLAGRSGEAALEVLEAAMLDPTAPPQCRVSAAQTILTYAKGSVGHDTSDIGHGQVRAAMLATNELFGDV